MGFVLRGVEYVNEHGFCVEYIRLKEILAQRNKPHVAAPMDHFASRVVFFQSHC
jgi:hypothetical protein